jgi:hypothetical protein
MHNMSDNSQLFAMSSSAEQRARVPSPLVVFLVVWILPLSILGLGIVQYEGVRFESQGTLYLAVCLVFFTIGFGLGNLRKSYSKLTILSQASMNERLAQDIHHHQRLITYFALAGILAALLFSMEMLFVVGIQPTSFEDTRAAFSLREVTILSQAATVLGAGGFFSLVAVILGWSQLSRRRRILWLLSPMLLSAFSLLSAGRQTVLQLVLIAFFALLLRTGPKGSRLRRFAVNAIFGGIVFLTLAYGMTVSSLRSGEDVTGKKGALLSQGFMARLDVGLDAALEDQSAVIRDGSAELLFYFTHPIPNFLIFFDQPRPGPYWGLWELPFLARRLESLGIVSSSVDARIDRVYAMFAISGRAPQVWQTGFRDLIIDFGDIGALIVVLLFGFWAGRVYFRMRTYGGLIWAYLLVGVNLLCVYSALLSGISDTLVFFYLVVAVLMYFRFESNVKAPIPSDPKPYQVSKWN